ncbi:MAG: hypothetical protein ACKO25_06820 [Cyanobium sp.]
MASAVMEGWMNLRLLGLTALALVGLVGPLLPAESAVGMAEQDCAPWDGPAFGLWIPAASLGGAKDSWIYLRIWRQPEQSAGVFHFPQTASRFQGAVTYLLDLPSPRAIRWQSQPRQVLSGQVRFVRINRRETVQGELDFRSDQQVHLRGSFLARWLPGSRPC